MSEAQDTNEAADGASGAPSALLGAWLPIETAPKDTRILLGYSRPVFAGVSAIFGNWQDAKYAAHPKPYWSHDMERLIGKREVLANQPTHWMPNIEAPNS